MEITTRSKALMFLANTLERHEQTVPEYIHFVLPNTGGVGIGLWNGDRKDSIVCDVTVFEAGRMLTWRLGDQIEMAPAWWGEDLSCGFRNDYKANKEGFNVWINNILSAIGVAA